MIRLLIILLFFASTAQAQFRTVVIPADSTSKENDVIQRKGGFWLPRTMEQLKADLNISGSTGSDTIARARIDSLVAAVALKANITDLADVAFSGSYLDLLNLPTIPDQIDTTSLSDRINEKVNIIPGKQLSTEDYSTAEKNKLSGIANNATANSTDDQLRDRSTHTGQQPQSSVTNLSDSLLKKADTSWVNDKLLNYALSSALTGKANLAGGNVFTGNQTMDKVILTDHTTNAGGLQFGTTSPIYLFRNASGRIESSAIIQSTGGVFTGSVFGNSYQNTTTGNNSTLNLTNQGASIIRNNPDAGTTNAALTVNQQQGLSDVLRLQFAGSDLFRLTYNGFLLGNNHMPLSGATYNLYHRENITNGIAVMANGATTLTSGTRNTFNITETFSPTSGTSDLRVLNIIPVINQTGGASGVSRGIYINPTLTAASDWRAIEIASAGRALFQTNSSANNYFNGMVGFKTTSPTHTITLESTATGIASYNTSDQTTNYDRVRNYWSSNIYRIEAESAGTGTLRPIIVSGAGRTFLVGGTGFTGIFSGGFGTSAADIAAFGTNGSHSNTTGYAVSYAATPNYNQSGTAGYKTFYASVYEQALGSGLKLLMDLGTNSTTGGLTANHTSKFTVDNAGNTTAGSYKVSSLNAAPASATATGTTGEIRITATHIYVCTATNTWVRSALTTW